MNKLNLMPMTRENKVEYVADSREVAEMLGKEHCDLSKNIKVYMKYLAESNFSVGDFFIKSNYKDLNNQKRPCYLLTKQGCEMVANKMTGKKGILFTATYVQAFNDMEQQLRGNVSLDSMLGTLQEFKVMQENIEIMKKNMKLVQNNVNAIYEEVEESKKIGLGAYLMAKDVSEDINEYMEQFKKVHEVVNDSRWRKRTDTLLRTTAYSLGDIKCIANLRRKIYSVMEKRLGINFDDRIKRRGKRMAEEGICKSKIDKINPMTIITEDKRLIDSYVSAVRDVCSAFLHGVYSIED